MAKVKQLAVKVANRPGATGEVVKALGAAKVNVLALVGSAQNGEGVVHLVVDNAPKAKKALDAAHIAFSEATVEQVELANRPGALAAYLEKLARKNVNLNLIYATASRTAKKATIVLSAGS